MDKRFENKLIMLKAVLSLLQQNQSLWQDAAPLAAVYADLKELVAQIEKLKLFTTQSNSGLVAAKQNLQEMLINQAFELASMLFAFARRNNDAVLQAKVDFTISQLRNLRDDELATKCLSVLALGQSNDAALVEYGSTSEKLNQFGELTNQYVEQLPNRRVTVSERKMANEKIKNLLAEALLATTEQLDRQMVRFKSEQADFYTSYQNARKVVDYGIRHEKPDDNSAPE